MRLKINHLTHYRFEQPVHYGMQQIRVTPKPMASQRVLSWSLALEGGRRELTFEDYHRNTVDLISIDRDATEVSIRSSGEIELTETHGVVGAHVGPAPLWLFERATPRTKAGTGCKALVRKVEGEGELERLHALMHLINAEVGYLKGQTDSDATAEESVTAGHGVCQDHAHIFCACAREMGFPARYVSGYLLMEDSPYQEATHAWAEAHVTGLGWVGFDVSNKQCPDVRYVRIATGLDYNEAAPVTGTRYGGEAEELTVALEVAQQ